MFPALSPDPGLEWVFTPDLFTEGILKQFLIVLVLQDRRRRHGGMRGLM